MRLSLGRARFIASFAALLSILVATTPVLGAEGDSQLGTIEPPNAAQVAEGLAAAEEAVEKRKRELRAPALQEERRASRSAFGDLASVDARDLLTETFAVTLAAVDTDPARYLSDVKLEKAFGESSARIASGGEKSLLESNVPVRTETENGVLKKVDLGLVETPAGFEPVNPLVNVQIPDTSAQPIAIGEEGLAVVPRGAERGGQVLDEKNVFFAEVREDTDLLVSPVSGGVEIFDQLRSADSPEALVYDLLLPHGARVEKNAAGGADVLRGKEILAYIAPPSAIDAQETTVPVDLQVDGSSLVVSVPHAEEDFAYPILVDPAITESYGGSWYGGDLTSLGVWTPSGDPTQTYYLRSSYCLTAALCSPSGRGLFIEGLDGWIPANTYSQFYYTVPGTTTYIPSLYPELSAHINPFWRTNNGCSWEKYPQPHDYAGSFNASGTYTTIWTDRAQWYGDAQIFDNAKGIAFGLSTGGAGVNLGCDRDIMVGGVAVRLDDPEDPTLSSVTGVPSGWVKAGQSFTITANISDPGLGVQNVRLYPDGHSDIPYVSPSSVCPGTKASPCQPAVSAGFNVSDSNFDQGEQTLEVSGTDPTGGTSNTITKTTRVDREAPLITLKGTLATATEENKPEVEDPKKWDKLTRPIYRLNVIAKDGSKEPPTSRRSGVKKVEVYLDEEPVETWSVESCEYSCAIDELYDLQLFELGTGKHTVKVVAKDWLEQERSRTIEFEYFPATGDKDEYVMERFPLDNGTDPEEPGVMPWPELSVNVANGNVVYTQRDIDVEGPAVDLEVERVYNSLLPEELNTEWGDGWTLAQTPSLDPVDTGGGPAPDQADVLDPTGRIEDEVELPEGTGASTFDADLQSSIEKLDGGGFKVSDESGEGEGSIVFDSAGRAQSQLAEGDTRVAEVDYSYDGGELSEITVEDPNSSTEPPPKPPPIAEFAEPRFVANLGKQGSSEGEFLAPADAALDELGNLWVVDEEGDRIQQFDENGDFVMSFDGSGGEGGQLSRPTAITIDGDGRIWIADSGNSRVQLFDKEGVYLDGFGTAGSGDGEFAGAGPEGIAVDSEFNVWVSDTYGGRLQQFTEGGVFVQSVGSGQLGEPRGLDTARDGSVWVADWLNNRVSVFGEEGALIRHFGSWGGGNGKFRRPAAVEVGAQGSVWVADERNGRVQQFNSGGEFVTKFGVRGSELGDLARPTGLAADERGNVWVTDSAGGRNPGSDSEDPTAAYPLDAGSGTVAEDLFGNHDGTIEGPSWTEGRFGKGLDFDGEDDCLSVPNSLDLQLGEAFTLEAWVRPEAAEAVAPIFFKDAETQESYSLWVGGDNAGHLDGYIAEDPWHWSVVTSPNVLPVNTWSHIAMTSDRTTLRLYLNGAEVDSTSAKDAMESEGPLTIGCAGVYESYFDGKIDEPRIYNRALGPEEIAADKDEAIDDFISEDPTAAYPLDAGSGTVAEDLFGNHDGTIEGPSWTEGRFGKGLDFDGEDDCLSVPNSLDLQLGEAFTLEAWVRPEAAEAVAPIFFKDAETQESYSLWVGGDNAGHLDGYIAEDPWHWSVVTSPNVLPVNTWSHIAMTSDRTTLRLYLNGAEVDSTSAKDAMESEGPLTIGCAGVYESYFDGKIDEPRIYNRALGPEEIAADKDEAIEFSHDQVQLWAIPNYVPDYRPLPAGSVGSSGSGNGAFDAPADVEIDSKGNIWVADTGNDRIQKFNSSGSYLAKFGTSGSSNGQFDRPTAIAFDPEGNILVADSGNDRIQVFDPEGGFELKFGKSGSGDGEFDSPEGITVTAVGEIWVADTGNDRLQVFDSEGEHLRTIGSEGSQPGELEAPRGLDRAFGLVFVADSGNDRIQKFDADGEAPRGVFGVSGSDPGELQEPNGLEVDADGIVWVADTGNDRVQGFGENGERVRTLAEPGLSSVELDAPRDLASDPSGQLLVADTGNDKLQKWATPGYAALDQFFELTEGPNDPEVAVETSGDLIESVEGDEAGEHSYEHEGDDLISHDGPDGETSFDYDGAGLMTRVELPNGTEATMAYEEGSNRVESVTVTPDEGTAETTYFTYNDEEMKTIVERPEMPAVEYLYDESGAVLKMWNAADAPEVVLSGSLLGVRETKSAIKSGLYELEVVAHSEHGVKSIEILDGNVIVSEKHCAQDPEVEGIECKEVPDEWVVETESMAPGIHTVEVLVTNELNRTASERFWVNIPEVEPLPQGEEERPRFARILRYRIEHGLDLDLDPMTQEAALNDRIFDLMRAWGNPHTPLGEVARYGSANWGVPMRPIDVAEMEYREWYLEINTPLIENWGEESQPLVYGGISIDHSAGGLMSVAFTSEAGARLAELKSALPGLVAEDRLSPAMAAHAKSLKSLTELGEEIAEASEAVAGLDTVKTVDVDREANVVRIGADNASLVTSELKTLYGASVPVLVEETKVAPLENPFVKNMAGEHWMTARLSPAIGVSHCTSGYGAWSKRRKNNGEWAFNEWQMTAGHCGELEGVMRRSLYPRGGNEKNSREVGVIRLQAYPPGVSYPTDVLGVDMYDALRAPRYIYKPWGPRRVTYAGWIHEGDELCFSGVVTGEIECGDAYGGISWVKEGKGDSHRKAGLIKVDAVAREGDSGGPVWNRTTNTVVGMVSFATIEVGTGAPLAPYYVVPLIKPKRVSQAKVPGALGALSDALGKELDLIEAPR